MTRHIVTGYEIDDDPIRIDAGAAVAFLTTEAYWGRWRDDTEIRRQLAEAWRVVGVYDQSGAMVGLARAFSDGATAYLADVYVLSAHRGAGLGKALVRVMVEDGPGADYRWMLHTSDAHGLYRSFGFTTPDGRLLERSAQGVRAGGERRGGQPPRDRGVSGGRPPELKGEVVRLEPLGHQHVAGLVAASSGGAELYRWSAVPQDEPAARRYVETAIAARETGTAAPFAVVRIADDTVIGSTRFWALDYWAWPGARPRTGPDSCEIGHTWLAASAVRTGANTEMKRLMLTYAFEDWRVQSVCLHTDARNQRSRDAMHRIGARFEGILRSHRLGTDLTPRNSARFSITAAEWPAVRRRLAELTCRYQPA